LTIVTLECDKSKFKIEILKEKLNILQHKEKALQCKLQNLPNKIQTIEQSLFSTKDDRNHHDYTLCQSQTTVGEYQAGKVFLDKKLYSLSNQKDLLTQETGLLNVSIIRK
jgi:chromosome segregation ATPase